MKIYYINSQGKKLDFNSYPFKMLSSSSIFDYSWKYEFSTYNRVKRIKRTTKTFTVSIVVYGKTFEEYMSNLTELFEVLDKDCITETAGRLYCDEYYVKCFFAKSVKPKKVLGTLQTTVNFTVVIDGSGWIREKQYLIKPYMEGVSETTGGDFAHDYPMDYARELPTKRIVNDGIAPVNFELVVYGPCENPEIVIGGNMYKVNTSLVAGEYMKVNSITKKVYKVKANGEQISVFNLRDRDNYIFEKIVPGINDVSWDGTFGFDITILEERSEPKWI